MEIDKVTLTDLSIMDGGDDLSIFNKLDFCRTLPGREKLFENFTTPLKTIEEIVSIQDTLRCIMAKADIWPTQISNGSIMVIQKFYHTTIDQIPANPSSFSAYSYRLLHGPDFHLVKYSAQHAFDFIKGLQLTVAHFLNDNTPAALKNILLRVKKIIDKEQFRIIEKHEKVSSLTLGQQLHLAHFIRYNYKQNMFDLLDAYFQLDAWYGMAMAVKQFGLVFPEFVHSDEPVVKAKGLYHLLLEKPVDYCIELNPQSNFIFLTGANMAGKSTFIKSVGSAVFLAHIGMGVPAQQMQLSLFDGMLSNINVVDNIVKGESYFYNEVQRIKATINKITDKRKWLILIDELFKGTNVEDAMKCSLTVIEGMLKIKNSLFILSTHLYEIGEGLKKYPNISFNYFETSVTDNQLNFSYHLKEGISNDRLGYLILKREGVVDILDKL
ncbi:MutS-related protein [Ferruginibacter sp. SUN002]|uniref:MutS-related protein n=1 Tax=Ferruginibacter sp. SUN002 TaxID=2937789 RepID=UPI003D36FFDC